MARERFKWRTRKNLSTDAAHRDGPGRSSEEASVMGVERRPWVIRLLKLVNHLMGGTIGESKVV